MGAPTKNSIIGQFINGRSAQDDFLQLADNHGGTVFAWIDYLGHLNGSFLASLVPGGPNLSLQFNNSGAFGGESTLTFPNLSASSFEYLYLGDPFSSLSPNNASNDPASWDTKMFISSVGTGGTHGEIWGLQVAAFNPALSGGGAVGAQISSVAETATGMNLETSPTLLSGHTIPADSIKGLDNEVVVRGVGTITDIDVIESELDVFDATATVTTGRHLHIRDNTGSGTVVNMEGVHIESFSVAGGYIHAIEVDDQGTGANAFAILTHGQTPSQYGGNATWQNPTAATNLANQNSPILTSGGSYWTGSASATDKWTIQDVVGTGTNPTSTLTFVHVGTPGVSTVSFPSNVTVLGNLTLSFGNANLQEILSNFNTGSSGLVIPISAAANASGSTTAYTVTIAPGGQLTAGQYVTITGFTNGANNGRFIVFSCTTTTMVVYNASGVAETHAATGTTDVPYVNNAGGFSTSFGNTSITNFAISGVNTTPIQMAEARIPNPNIAFTAKGDSTDAGYIRLINDGATGNHGLEIGAIVDGTGASPVTLQLGDVLGGVAAAVLNVPLTIKGATPTGSTGQLSFGTTTATSATAGANGDVPAQVVGYLVVDQAGTKIKIPYYAV